MSNQPLRFEEDSLKAAQKFLSALSTHDNFAFLAANDTPLTALSQEDLLKHNVNTEIELLYKHADDNCILTNLISYYGGEDTRCYSTKTGRFEWCCFTDVLITISEGQMRGAHEKISLFVKDVLRVESREQLRILTGKNSVLEQCNVQFGLPNHFDIENCFECSTSLVMQFIRGDTIVFLFKGWLDDNTTYFESTLHTNTDGLCDAIGLA